MGLKIPAEAVEIRGKKERNVNGYHRCYAQISLGAIGHNIAQVRKRIPQGVKLMAVIKADAYGHGAVEVGRYLEPRADYFAVATVEEAVELREAGIQLPILILGYTSPREFEALVEHGITQTLYSLEDARLLSGEALRQGKRARVHLAVDTGMTRIGFQVTEQDADQAAQAAGLPGLFTEGIFTHFSCADQEDKGYCAMQTDRFERMLALLEQRKTQIPLRHICNSAGIMEFDRYRYEMVRAGIVTYGLYPSEEVRKENLELQPALAWRTHVIHVKDVEPGRGVSYGATYVTSRPVTRIATLSVGYADGYPRALSSKGRVLIRGQYAPILGRVCMDQMMVDVSGIPGVQVEDVATLVGRDQEKCISVEEVADPAARFNYEMVCGISSRVPRIYVE